MNAFWFVVILPLSLLGIIVVYNSCVSWAMKKAAARSKRNPVTGVLHGAEPIFLQGSNGKACLLVHGFIGSPTDFGRLPELLHKMGYTVSVPLLPGHGTDPKEFSKTTPEQLLSSVQENYVALKKNHSQVILLGLSLGAALSLVVAAKLKVDALVLLAPYLKIKHQWFYLLPTEWYHAALSPFIPYVYRLSYFKQVFRRDALSGIIDYSFVSMRGVTTTLKVGRMAQTAAENLKAPTLIIHSTKDRATDYYASLQLSRKLKGYSRLVTLENSNHIILWDYEAEAVENEIINFVEKFEATKASHG